MISHLANVGDAKHPRSCTLRRPPIQQLSDEQMDGWHGVTPDMVRMSASGLEDLDDILYDLDRGLTEAVR